MAPDAKTLGKLFPLLPPGILPPKGESAASLPKSWVAICNKSYGCIACAKFPQYTYAGRSHNAYAQFQVTEYRQANFMRHQRTDGHKNACLAVMGMNPDVVSNFDGPSKACWGRVAAAQPTACTM